MCVPCHSRQSVPHDKMCTERRRGVVRGIEHRNFLAFLRTYDRRKTRPDEQRRPRSERFLTRFASFAINRDHDYHRYSLPKERTFTQSRFEKFLSTKDSTPEISVATNVNYSGGVILFFFLLPRERGRRMRIEMFKRDTANRSGRKLRGYLMQSREGMACVSGAGDKCVLRGCDERRRNRSRRSE